MSTYFNCSLYSDLVAHTSSVLQVVEAQAISGLLVQTFPNGLAKIMAVFIVRKEIGAIGKSSKRRA